jgi:hypothetical protein
MSDISPHPPATYENHGQLHTVPLKLKVSEYELVCTIISAIEGGVHGIAGWCRKIRLRDKDIKVIEQSPTEVWNEYIARNVALGGTLTFYTFDDKIPYTLTQEKLINAYSLVFEKGWFTDRIDGVDKDGELEIDGDGPMADVLIQFALFGEQVYG